MTELEATVLAARLTRIWKPVNPFIVNPWVGVGPNQGSAWCLMAILNFEFGLEAYVDDLEGPPFLRIDAPMVNNQRSAPILWADSGRMYRSNDDENIAAHWLPFFRRGCWLCGCAIEARAHEKAEWMRDFTREEIESWNLKM